MKQTEFKTLSKAAIKRGARVIFRADFDVAINGGAVTDDFRILEALPAIKFILRRGGRLRIVSHLGRPDGKFSKELSMRKVAEKLAGLLKKRVIFVADPFSKKSFDSYGESKEIIFFENIRFWPGEEKNDQSFARKIARWGDVYVNEAFANCHRKHASMVAVAKLLPSFAGFRLEKEIKMLGGVFADSRKPFVAVLGGAKISTKLPLIRRFLDEADSLLVGGAIASTIFYLFGYEVGKSIIDKDAGRIVKAALFKNKKLHLPVDVVVAKSLSRESRHKVKKPEEAKKNDFIVDIGPESAKLFASFARSAKTIVWNGPLGYTPYFPRGTISFARALGKMKAFKVVGGGDTIAALRKRGLLKGFSHVSTGGGAMLEFLAGKKLPGIEALREK